MLSCNTFSFSASNSLFFRHSCFLILCTHYLLLLSFPAVVHGASCARHLLHPPVHFNLSGCYFFMLLIKPPGKSLSWSLFAYCLFSHLNNHPLTFIPVLITILFFSKIKAIHSSFHSCLKLIASFLCSQCSSTVFPLKALEIHTVVLTTYR